MNTDLNVVVDAATIDIAYAESLAQLIRTAFAPQTLRAVVISRQRYAFVDCNEDPEQENNPACEDRLEVTEAEPDTYKRFRSIAVAWEHVLSEKLWPHCQRLLIQALHIGIGHRDSTDEIKAALQRAIEEERPQPVILVSNDLDRLGHIVAWRHREQKDLAFIHCCCAKGVDDLHPLGLSEVSSTAIHYPRFILPEPSSKEASVTVGDPCSRPTVSGLSGLVSDLKPDRFPATPAPQANQSEASPVTEQHIWSWFLNALATPGTINGLNKMTRWGFKARDGRLFLNEHLVRKAFAQDCLKQPERAEMRQGDGTYPVTRELLEVLGEKGVVVCEWNGLRFKPTSALWKVEAVKSIRNTKTGALAKCQTITAWPVAIVLDLGAYTPKQILDLAPSPWPPEITAPVFPQRALKSPSSDDDNRSSFFGAL